MINYVMPAEWEKHAATWLAWPHDKISFPNRVEKVENRFVEIIKALSESEEVELLVLDEKMKSKVEDLLQSASVEINKVTFHITDYAEIWTRDYGPTFVKDPSTHELAWVKWDYNAYGNKFPALLKDTQVFLNLRSSIDKRMFEPGLVMEGGAIEVNGQGTLITTEQCLLNENRNPHLSKIEIENHLKEYLGVTNIIWLKEGILNDHTDGHIDDLVKFVSPTTLLCAYEENTSDENYKILKQNYEDLEKAKDQNGKPFTLVKLPMPHMNYEDSSAILEPAAKAPVSYANFYIGNEVVLVPTYKDPNDQKALEIIQAQFPDRKVVGIDCTDIIYGGGALHCMTQQMPL